MKRCQVIDALSELQLDLATCEVQAELYVHSDGGIMGGEPELVWPWLHGLTVRLWWARGFRGSADGWRVRLTDWAKDTTEGFTVCDTLAECMAWLAEEGE